MHYHSRKEILLKGNLMKSIIISSFLLLYSGLINLKVSTTFQEKRKLNMINSISLHKYIQRDTECLT